MRVLSSLPGGGHTHYSIQRFISHSLPIGDAALEENVKRARKHIDHVRSMWQGEVNAAQFYEFGVGWDLSIPIALYGMGVNRQLLVDIRPLVRSRLVQDIIERIRRVKLGLDRLPEVTLEAMGLEYRAPMDARHTPFERGSIDCITSTAVLEHIPVQDIPPLLRECRHLLAPNGVASFLIDYQDHYSHSYANGRITAYNYLRFSEAAWRRYNSPLHFQNRLRHCEYLQMFRDAGFRVIHCEPTEGSDSDLEALAQLDIHPAFRAMSPRALAVRDAWVVLVPGT
jgi:SAM-dependent methyltransferase